MKIIDPGHKFLLPVLDGGDDIELTFVKRVGEMFPGNTAAYPGTTLQEVLRACISRCGYLNNQITSEHTLRSIHHMERSIFELELRAATRHNRVAPSFANAVYGLTCPLCLHTGCKGGCHAS